MASAGTNAPGFFEQRDVLVNEIAMSLENVLQNLNKLNRSLEAVTAVGNEFGAVETLWSQFEGIMAQDETVGKAEEARESADRRPCAVDEQH